MKNLQEEDKEYLRKNVDHHSDAVANKTIEKDVGKHSTKCEQEIQDRSDEFIFDDSEEKNEAKNIKNWGICEREDRKLTTRH